MACFIVAEIGVNAGKNVAKAMTLVHLAKQYGADFCKFQLWSKDTFPELENLRFSQEEMLQLKMFAKEKDIGWFCTPFDKESIDYLAKIGMKIWKVPSGYVVEEEYLNHMASKNPEWVIMSLGKGNKEKEPEWKHIENSVHIFKGCKKTYLYCVSKYPALPEDYNFKILRERAINGLNWKFDMGFSDHSTSIGLPIAAVTMGATVIEMHITIKRTDKGPDHKASLTPHEFGQMVQEIRAVEKALHNG